MKVITLCKDTLMFNPFKFGSVVEEKYFTDRDKELLQVRQIVSSPNHLVLISPRRFGKTSLINKAVKGMNRPVISLNLQLVTSVDDFASHLLKQVFKLYPLERIKHLMQGFRIIPTISSNAVTGAIDVTLQPTTQHAVILEDVFGLIEKLGEKGEKPIVILDEFQEVKVIQKGLDKQLRSILQLQSHVNYVFLGSQESMMQEIFEKKSSSFYHFGYLMRLEKIPYNNFLEYISTRISPIIPSQTNRVGEISQEIAKQILEFTKCHPYYTQQLAFQVWYIIERTGNSINPTEEAIEEILSIHDYDYERLWVTLNNTQKKILIAMSNNMEQPTGGKFIKASNIGASSTAYSAITQLCKSGYLIKNPTYEIDDPFFAKWIYSKVNNSLINL